ncbi:MAG TPA: aminotransferase class III-fold pyridoxal phosphate-dependent enzyme [Myxococcales bacterium]|nr:aminotransferase class III-fold pyridoxal phosphate-dependent enzyme [Myxococcales bacterium]
MTLKAPHIQTEIPGPKSRELVQLEQKHLAPGLQGFALSSGIAVEKAQGSVIEDVDGNRYVDLIGGIGVNSLGHCHPAYTKALHEQIDKATVGSFTSAPRAELINEIARLAPRGVDRVQLYSGGAEAVESAFRLAKNHTGHHEVVGFWGGFHGKTAGTLSVNGSGNAKTYGPVPPGHVLPFANCYRCPLKLTYPSCGIACADLAREQLKHQSTGSVAAVIMEPLQGTAGNVIPPPEFMQRAKEIAHENGAVFISDEMITGFGRTGRWFACERSNVTPDIITIGKAFGSGFPISGLIARNEIAQAKPWSNPSGSSSSYGGNPLGAAAALAAVKTLQKENVLDNVRSVGKAMIEELRTWPDRLRWVGDVRGEGLFLAVELVKDRASKEPLDKKVCGEIFQDGLRRGLLAMSYTHAIRLQPALTIDHPTALSGLRLLFEAIEAVARRHGAG